MTMSLSAMSDYTEDVAVFTSIVVPVDLGPEGDRALPLAGSLAVAAGIPIELVCVTEPSMPEGVDAYELERRAAALAPAACTWTVIHGDAAEALVSFIGRRPDALVVMATHARGVLAEQIFGSVSEAVMARTDHAVLFVGPHAAVAAHPVNPTLVAGVDGSDASEAVLPVLASWMRTFGGNAPWLVEVLRPSSEQGDLRRGDTLESGYVKRLADQLQQHGIEAEWDVAHGRHPADALIDFADRLNDRVPSGGADPVLAVASERWTDPEHHHWLSVARTLTHRSRHPVLVVAAEGVTP